MDIDAKLLEEIKKFCELNNIEDIEAQINSCLRYGFNVLKFGDNPFTYHNPMDDKENNTEKIDKHGLRHGKATEGFVFENTDSIHGGTESNPEEKGKITEKPKRKIKIIKN